MKAYIEADNVNEDSPILTLEIVTCKFLLMKRPVTSQRGVVEVSMM